MRLSVLRPRVFFLFCFKPNEELLFLDGSENDRKVKKWCSIVFVVGPNSFNGNQKSVKTIKAIKKGEHMLNS